jgi:hypothetical protein
VHWGFASFRRPDMRTLLVVGMAAIAVALLLSASAPILEAG